jgi:hypothetical protein
MHMVLILAPPGYIVVQLPIVLRKSVLKIFTVLPSCRTPPIEGATRAGLQNASQAKYTCHPGSSFFSCLCSDLPKTWDLSRSRMYPASRPTRYYSLLCFDFPSAVLTAARFPARPAV